MTTRDPLGNMGRIIDIRAELQRRRAERIKRNIKYAVNGLGIVIAAALLCFFFWRGVWETFT